MKWRIAKSLDVLRAQLNTKFPNRSKVSDGSIGDLRHSKTVSDHNPNKKGVVCALDFTFDTDPSDGIGIDCHWLAAVLVASRDPRIKYIIWNGRIISSRQQPWIWRPYSGKNPHRAHLHLSVCPEESLYDDETAWKLDGSKAEITAGLPELSIGARGEHVTRLQYRLFELGFFKYANIDACFGRVTRNAVFLFQQARGLEADGICGERMWRELGFTQGLS